MTGESTGGHDSDTMALLRALSHRLKTPLATLHGYGSLIEGYADDERVVRWGQMVQQEAERLSELLGDLSLLARLMRGEAQRAPVDLAHLARSALALVEAESERTVSLDSPGLLWITGDEPALERALYHLAWLASRGDQPGSIRLEEAESWVCITAEWGTVAEPSERGDPWLQLLGAVATAHGGQFQLAKGSAILRLPGV